MYLTFYINFLSFAVSCSSSFDIQLLMALECLWAAVIFCVRGSLAVFGLWESGFSLISTLGLFFRILFGILLRKFFWYSAHYRIWFMYHDASLELNHRTFTNPKWKECRTAQEAKLHGPSSNLLATEGTLIKVKQKDKRLISRSEWPTMSKIKVSNGNCAHAVTMSP